MPTRQHHPLLAVCVLAALAACAAREAEPEASGGPSAALPQQAIGATQRGEASYYGPQVAGRATASGERFDPSSDMAAHRALPLGTRARVANLRNGRSTTVRIRDRGPYVTGR